jgi:thiol:disulfide interchange protein
MFDQTRSVLAVIAEEPAAEVHPFSVDDQTSRHAIPAERKLLLLLQAAQRAARQVQVVHDNNAEYCCSCSICKTAAWTEESVDFAAQSIFGVLIPGKPD